jgi:hypothetical protein
LTWSFSRPRAVGRARSRRGRLIFGFRFGGRRIFLLGSEGIGLRNTEVRLCCRRDVNLISGRVQVLRKGQHWQCDRHRADVLAELRRCFRETAPELDDHVFTVEAGEPTAASRSPTAATRSTYFVKDTKPGQTNGEGLTGFGDRWDPVSATGTAVQRATGDDSDEDGTAPIQATVLSPSPGASAGSGVRALGYASGVLGGRRNEPLIHLE